MCSRWHSGIKLHDFVSVTASIFSGYQRNVTPGYSGSSISRFPSPVHFLGLFKVIEPRLRMCRRSIRYLRECRLAGSKTRQAVTVRHSENQFSVIRTERRGKQKIFFRSGLLCHLRGAAIKFGPSGSSPYTVSNTKICVCVVFDDRSDNGEIVLDVKDASTGKSAS